MDIQHVNRRQIEDVVRRFKPLGLFYTKQGNKYIGVDNSGGDAWTEEFDSLEDCKKWLGGD